MRLLLLLAVLLPVISAKGGCFLCDIIDRHSKIEDIKSENGDVIGQRARVEFKFPSDESDDEMEGLKGLKEATGLLSGLTSMMSGAQEMDSPSSRSGGDSPFPFPNPFALISKIFSGGASPRKESEEKSSKPSSPLSSFNPFEALFSTIAKEKGSSSMNNANSHICVREFRANSSSEIERTTKCDQFADAKRCVSTKLTKKGMTELWRIEECCEGYTTKNMKKESCKEAEAEEGSGEEDLPGLTNNTEPATTIRDFLKTTEVVLPGIQRQYEWTNGKVLVDKKGGRYVVSQSEDSESIWQTRLNCLSLFSHSTLEGNQVQMTSYEPIAPAQDSILKLLESHGNFTKFLSILSDYQRKRLADSSAESTVFAWSDEVFDDLSDDMKRKLDKNGACLGEITDAHIASGWYCSHALLDEAKPLTLSSSMIPVQVAEMPREKIIRIGSAKVVERDLVAINGIVHLVDDVIIREELLPWQDRLSVFNPKWTKLVNETLGNSTELVTIFVPRNAENLTLADAPNHIVKGVLIRSYDEMKTAKTMAGSKLFMGSLRDSRFGSIFGLREKRGTSNEQVMCSFEFDDAIAACSSIIHFIDEPLPVATQSFGEHLASRADLSRFYALWKNSSSAAFMENDDVIRTAFVPMDDAISNNLFKKLMENEEQRHEFVKAHIVSRPICNKKFDSIRHLSYTNMNNSNLTPEIRGGKMTAIEGQSVTEYKILSNGLIYVIDGPIAKRGGRLFSLGRD